jgi:hypothetical protein
LRIITENISNVISKNKTGDRPDDNIECYRMAFLLSGTIVELGTRNFFLCPQSKFRNLKESISQLHLCKCCSATACPQFSIAIFCKSGQLCKELLLRKVTTAMLKTQFVIIFTSILDPEPNPDLELYSNYSQ